MSVVQNQEPRLQTRPIFRVHKKPVFVDPYWNLNADKGHLRKQRKQGSSAA